MKAKEIGLLQFIRTAKQFVIPIYQRPYRWDEPQCRRLWEDVMRAGNLVDGGSPHFVGSMVYIEANVYQVADQPRAVQRCRMSCTEAALPHVHGEVRRLVARGIPELENV